MVGVEELCSFDFQFHSLKRPKLAVALYNPQ